MWNLTQAWAWIRFRDNKLVEKFVDEDGEEFAAMIMYPGVADPLTVQPGDDGRYRKILDEDLSFPVIEGRHQWALLDALRRGKIHATGRRAGGPRENINPIEWSDLVLQPPSTACLRPGRNVLWRLVQFEEGEITREWLAQEGGSVDAASREHPNLPLSMPSASASRPKPSVAKEQLRRWYLDRVNGWPPDARPANQARDVADAKAAFPNNLVTRDGVRALRSELAPEEWRAPGRRAGNLARKK